MSCHSQRFSFVDGHATVAVVEVEDREVLVAAGDDGTIGEEVIGGPIAVCVPVDGVTSVVEGESAGVALGDGVLLDDIGGLRSAPRKVEVGVGVLDLSLVDAVEVRAGSAVPQAQRAAPRPRKQPAVGQREGAFHPVRVPLERRERGAGGAVPQAQGPVGRPRQEPAVGQREGVPHPTRVPLERHKGGAGGAVPQA